MRVVRYWDLLVRVSGAVGNARLALEGEAQGCHAGLFGEADVGVVADVLLLVNFLKSAIVVVEE